MGKRLCIECGGPRSKPLISYWNRSSNDHVNAHVCENTFHRHAPIKKRKPAPRPRRRARKGGRT